jgi:GNAT superfamily N-acetyltransferase
MRKACRNPEEEAGRAWAERRGLRVVVKPPSACTAEELEGFRQMVLLEWQVSDEGLEERIARSKVLVIIYDPFDKMIAIGAAKKPQSSYARKVFTKAGVLGWSNYEYEVGYIYVLPEYRGHLFSRLLMEALIDACGDVSIFATTKADNERMIRTNRRLNFIQAGVPFQSERGPYNILLWTREIGGHRPDGLGFTPTEWEETERNPEEQP